MEVPLALSLLNVDGSISAFRIHNGHVDYQQKYVKTDRFMYETKHRRNLFGRYRNPFTGAFPFVQLI
jgi:carotenoid cleavage dioxygenase